MRGEKDQASQEGSAAPEMKHLSWELLVQIIKLVAAPSLLLYPVIKVFWIKDLNFLLEVAVGDKGKCM